MSTVRVDSPSTWPPFGWLLIAVTALAVAVVFHDGLAHMITYWSVEEYSYAWLVPPVCAWLVWHRLQSADTRDWRGSWWGPATVLAGIGIAFFGELSTIYTLIHYAFLLTVFGLTLTLAGWRGAGTLLAPLAYLVFMVPLPTFLFQALSGELQLLSSGLGVLVIRALGIPVFLEGNVIDLGTYKLQVVEACSGLRYLFPLMSFGYLCAYLYQGPWWQKAVLFLSTIPITVFLNSFRIGVIGVLVDLAGIGMAEGFLHFFEGWVIFIAAVLILFGEIIVLARLSGRREPLRVLLRLDQLWPGAGRGVAARGTGGMSDLSIRVRGPFLVSASLLAISALAVLAMPARPEIVPERTPFVTFPMRVDVWRGRDEILDPAFVEVLKLDDYVLADYAAPGQAAPVNFYLAYYSSQRKGASVHSPRSCIPGGGWEIVDLRRHRVEGVGTAGHLVVNRAVIANGLNRQLVYYWFQQRGHQLTNEYLVKWMIFQDALTRRRTDGALVRLVTPFMPGEDDEAADRRLAAFLRAVYPSVDAYIPR